MPFLCQQQQQVRICAGTRHYGETINAQPSENLLIQPQDIMKVGKATKATKAEKNSSIN
jgi:hypothetical protein